MHQSTQTKVLLILLRNQSTLSPDEDQQHSSQNVMIHIYVTQSWDKRLNSAINNIYVELTLVVGKWFCHNASTTF